MAIKAYIHWIGGNQRQATHEIVDLLAKQGIQVQSFDACLVSCGYGIIFCSEVTPEICQQLRELSRNGQIQVLVCFCAAISNDAVWQLMETGASDVLVYKEYPAVILEIVERLQRWDMLEKMVNSPVVQDILVGESPTWKAVLRQVVEVSHFTDASVLILGESGTGKELLANLIHDLDPRPSKGSLVILDCSTIMPELSGSEFFGHERGAFTGAVSSRDGVFSLADGGTLFLDEVGELPITLQTQLLRVIQEHTFKRVGGNTWHRTSFRLVCATNQNLWEQVQCGKFRVDLYYRIASSVCHLPPLRERPEDILPLTYHFLKELRPGLIPPVLALPVQEYLIRREYPGNIRDLRQVVARMLCHYVGHGSITIGCIPPDDRPRTDTRKDWCKDGFERAIRVAMNRGAGLKSISRNIKDTAIRIALDDANGNLQSAALRLGVTARTLQMWRAEHCHEN